MSQDDEKSVSIATASYKRPPRTKSKYEQEIAQYEAQFKKTITMSDITKDCYMVENSGQSGQGKFKEYLIL